MAQPTKQDDINPKMIFGVFLLFITLMFSAIAVPRGKFVLVATNPTGDPAQIMDVISMAGGTFVTGTRLPWLAVAQSDDAGFAYRLFAHGAFLVLDHGLLSGCTEGKEK